MQPIIKSISTSRGVIVIREANLADVEQYRALRLFALQESPLAFGEDYESSRNYPPEYWHERLRNDEHSVTFIVEYEQKIMGMTGIHRRPLPKTRHSATIIGVFVHPQWRGLRILPNRSSTHALNGQKQKILLSSNWASMHQILLRFVVMNAAVLPFTEPSQKRHITKENITTAMRCIVI